MAEESGKIIRDVEASNDLKTAHKGDASPVTLADLKVQRTIEDNLRHFYPKLDIQGEESKESIADIESEIKPDSITEAHRKFLTAEFLNAQQAKRADFIKSLRPNYAEDEVSTESFTSFSTADATVWIDPLDGTSDFVKGNLPAVTVLIGLSINGKSRAGIVHNVFSFENQ